MWDSCRVTLLGLFTCRCHLNISIIPNLPIMNEFQVNRSTDQSANQSIDQSIDNGLQVIPDDVSSN